MKVLLAVDGSAYSKKMLAYLVTHRENFSEKNTFHLLNVQPALPSRAVGALGKAVVHDYHAEEAEKVLNPLSKFLIRHDVHATSSWQVGHAAEQISKLAKSDDFDLVVMGSHGHSALGNLVMGSVATQVLAQCQVPVLLVR